jgi:hemoglobin
MVGSNFVDDQDIYSVIGENGFERLVGAFYRQVPEDNILGPLYPKEDLPGAEKRLRDFLIFRFGGPQRYIQERGHPRLRMRHAPFPVNQAASERWLQLMGKAMAECGFPVEVKQTLWKYFEDTAAFMMNRQ